jgi:hypothetical protein
MLDINDPTIQTELAHWVEKYEIALATNDLSVMSELFWNDGRTVRFDPSGEQHGHQEIDEWRATRTPPGGREVIRTQITTFGSHSAIATVEFRRQDQPGIGRQMQTWIRIDGVGWRVVAAHISIRSE